jgi:hypothetical protein
MTSQIPIISFKICKISNANSNNSNLKPLNSKLEPINEGEIIFEMTENLKGLPKTENQIINTKNNLNDNHEKKLPIKNQKKEKF